MRICLDASQTINKAIIRPVYPIPTLEENIHRFHQAKVFSTFDIKDSFQAIKLTEESSMLITMHTPWGRYRWTRLPFGISSAPEEFQRRIHDRCCIRNPPKFNKPLKQLDRFNLVVQFL